jgi:hypothetical protein
MGALVGVIGCFGLVTLFRWLPSSSNYARSLKAQYRFYKRGSPAPPLSFDQYVKRVEFGMRSVSILMIVGGVFSLIIVVKDIV